MQSKILSSALFVIIGALLVILGNNDLNAAEKDKGSDSKFDAYWNHSLIGSSVPHVLRVVPSAQPNSKPQALINGAVDYVHIPKLMLYGVEYSVNYFFDKGKLSQIWFKSTSSLGVDRATSFSRSLESELDKKYTNSGSKSNLLSNSYRWSVDGAIASLLVNENESSNSGALTILFQETKSLTGCSINGGRTYFDILCIKNPNISNQRRVDNSSSNSTITPSPQYLSQIPKKQESINTLDAEDAIIIQNGKCREVKPTTEYTGDIVNISQFSTYRATVTVGFHYSDSSGNLLNRFDKKRKNFTLKPNTRYSFKVKSGIHSGRKNTSCTTSLSVKFVESTVKR